MVELDAERLEVAVLLLPQLADGEAADRLDVAQIVADFVEIPLRELADVFAAIAVFGKRRRARRGAPAPARAPRSRVLDLRAGVVVVELARDRGILPLQQVGDGVAERAWRPWPTSAGRRIRETNSTITGSPAARRRGRSDRARPRCARAPAWRAAGETKMLMKPAPAISVLATHGDGGSAASRACASSRGLRFAALASCSAAFDA